MLVDTSVDEDDIFLNINYRIKTLFCTLRAFLLVAIALRKLFQRLGSFVIDSRVTGIRNSINTLFVVVLFHIVPIVNHQG